jgi:hypothetical protein
LPTPRGISLDGHVYALAADVRLRSKGYNVGTIVSKTVSEYTATGNVFKVTLTDANGVTWNFTKGSSSAPRSA